MRKIFSSLCVGLLVTAFIGGWASRVLAADAKKLSMSIVHADDSVMHIAAKRWAELINQYTEGRYAVEVFTNDVLANGDQVKCMEMVQRGDIDMSFIPASIAGLVDVNLSSVIVPFLWKDVETIDKTLDPDSPVFKIFADGLLEKNLVALAFIELGYRQLTNNIRPVRTPDDMKGMKIRVANSPVFQEALRAFGANATGLSFTELFTALQQNALDGEENPVVAIIIPNKFYEVQKYLTVWDYVYEPLLPMLSKKLYDSLSDADKEAFRRSCKEVIVEHRQSVRAQDAEGLEFLKAQGMDVIVLTPEERQVFKDKLANNYDKWFANYNPQLVQALLEANK
ncbi:MAG: TRAP transporter substrate-binding protein [Deltaproteobacteria bacterium]|jgi:tripartite ATP-independent transporter DctP family solute receptor|nr:TRAP transporter substrate-binding protein [Deltaproteobacteria bacterium]